MTRVPLLGVSMDRSISFGFQTSGYAESDSFNKNAN